MERVPPKGAYFIRLPLRIGKGTGSPVRAIALVPKAAHPLRNEKQLNLP